jgi:serine/threonine protein phosphatase 1
MQTVTYAIGDIHGRADLLDDLLAQIEADAGARGARAKIVFTGDYIDRGPESSAVVERLIAGPRRAEDAFVCLRGNHDQLFVQAATDLATLPIWARQLHEHTLLSYRFAPDAPRPQFERHVAFLAALPLTHDDGTHFFVHAGVRPNVPLEQQAEQDLLWIRHEFMEYRGPLPRRIVHGHTIVGDFPEVTPNRISIDTGAYRSGILTAAVLDGGQPTFLATSGPPDKGAIVREAMIVATVKGRPLTARIRAAFDDFLSGLIGSEEMMAIVEGP